MLRRFRDEVVKPEAEIDFVRAYIALEAFAHPEARADWAMARLDDVTQEALKWIDARPVPAARLSEVLFQNLGFLGDSAHTGDPENSFFSQVLTRRRGIPISLSVVFLEVARRTGVEAHGLGVPGHFIVRARGSGESDFTLLDPFYGGTPISVTECAARVAALSGGRLAFRPQHLTPVGPRYILTRILNNLKSGYAAKDHSAPAAAVVERLLVLDPTNATEWRNLALVRANLGERSRSLDAWERFLALAPPSDETELARKYAAGLADQLARAN